jgi:hypothetical protein
LAKTHSPRGPTIHIAGCAVGHVQLAHGQDNVGEVAYAEHSEKRTGAPVVAFTQLSVRLDWPNPHNVTLPSFIHRPVSRGTSIVSAIPNIHHSGQEASLFYSECLSPGEHLNKVAEQSSFRRKSTETCCYNHVTCSRPPQRQRYRCETVQRNLQ